MGSSHGYKETLNVGYRDSDEDSPPVLPPRNYRATASGRAAAPPPPNSFSSSSAFERRPLPPLPAKSPQSPPPAPPKPAVPTMPASFSVGSDLTSVAMDFDSTPKADFYADQLRAQARRLSQNQPTARLNPARYNMTKALPDMKTSIIKSRPVEGQPRPQEARPLGAADPALGRPPDPSPPNSARLPPPSPTHQQSRQYRPAELDKYAFGEATIESGTPPSPSRSSTSPAQSQDHNANHQNNKLNATTFDMPTQMRTNDNTNFAGRLHKDYLGNQNLSSPDTRDRLLGNHYMQDPSAMVTPELPPPPTPLTEVDNSILSGLDASFTPPPPPPPALDASREQRSRSSVDEENTPDR